MSLYFDEHDCEPLQDGQAPNHMLHLARLVYAKCPICLAEHDERNKILEFPCHHHFHSKCITPWLEKTNSCPLCRHELPTDDKDYEEFKRQKAREKQRKFELETLHDSMFS
ncbi:hypothetical protein HELRODRAFT_74541 [Helobdella robusta]|uniref:RING-type E3 ubiquitin transferase n=1 Tax=Helobdella robusta TaxID=6412 RepID=T1G1S4_HELRO|nr:hypothetical protein HELRODRAFT_74541 [Helobdella robusta]ESO08959.1 hypothetical protein HELRODRAFT_74541 [Helobdella robusta]